MTPEILHGLYSCFIPPNRIWEPAPQCVGAGSKVSSRDDFDLD
jgi:hypothetical protein